MTDNALVRRKTAVKKDKGKGKKTVAPKDKDKDGKVAKGEPKDGAVEVIGALHQHVNDLDMSWEDDSMLADMLDGMANKDDHDDSKFYFLRL